MKRLIKHFVAVLAIVITLPCLSGCFETLESAWEDTKDTVSGWWGDVSDGAQETWEKVVKYSEPVVDKVKEGTQYVYDNVVHYSQEAYEYMQQKATEIAGDVQEYFTGTNDNDLKKYEIKYGEEQSSYYDDLTIKFSNPQGLNRVSKYNPQFEEFIPYYVSTILRSGGFEVYYGVAFLKGNSYTGLIFTNNDTYIEYQKQDIPVCGFIQVKLAEDNIPVVDESVVEAGLIAVPNEEYLSMKNCKKAYIVSDFTRIDEQAGIAFNQYFEFEQINDYCLNVKTRDGLPSNYAVYPHEIYDFDHQRVIKEKSNPSIRDDLVNLEKENKSALESGFITNNAIADIGETLEEGEFITNVITVSSDEVEYESIDDMKYKVDNFVESYNGTVEGNELEDFNHQNEIKNINDNTNLANAIVSTAGNVLAVAGTVAAIVIGVKAGSAVILGIVVVTGASAIVYNVSNIIEGAQDIYYGVNRLEGESVNPVYKLFNKVIKDEKTAKLVYNAWGIGNGVIAGLTVPANKAINIAHAQKLGHFRTAISVIRAVLTTVVKGAVAMIGAALIGNFVNKIVSYVTDSRFIGTLVGFGASLIAGMLIFKGLDNLDKQLNISGLYPKSKAFQSYTSDYYQEEKQYTWGNNDSDFRYKSEADKEYYIRSITEMACRDLGVQGRPNISYVYDYSHPADCGSYNYSTNTLEINLASPHNGTWSGMSNTIGHECRHFYQYENWDNDPEMAQSLLNYIRPEDDFYGYEHQLCEVDANTYGGNFMQYFLSWLGIVF